MYADEERKVVLLGCCDGLGVGALLLRPPSHRRARPTKLGLCYYIDFAFPARPAVYAFLRTRPLPNTISLTSAHRDQRIRLHDRLTPHPLPPPAGKNLRRVSALVSQDFCRCRHRVVPRPGRGRIDACQHRWGRDRNHRPADIYGRHRRPATFCRCVRRRDGRLFPPYRSENSTWYIGAEYEMGQTSSVGLDQRHPLDRGTSTPSPPRTIARI